MQITHLDRVNIHTTQLDKMVSWYRDTLGLVPGDRPDFPFPGAWLCAGETVMIHLVGTERPDLIGSEAGLKLEHFAFKARDAKSFEARLTEAGQDYRRVEINQINTVAFNVWDPDGNHIHVDFALDEQ